MMIKEIHHEFPMDLLLLADPSETLVKQYLEKGQCFIAVENEETIGVYVLLETSPSTIELVNVGVAEPYQKKE